MSWTLPKLPRDKFIELYGDKINVELFERQPKSETEYLTKYLPCKLWRMNNLHTIVDKKGKEIKFVMNNAQHIVYRASLEHSRLIILKSRQQGISTFWLISFIDDILVNKNLTLGLMAQGADEATTLLQRVKLDWQKLSPALKSALGLQLLKDNMKELKWSNGCMLFIRTSFRSATLQRLHISELAKIAIKNPKRAEETRTGTLQAIAPGNPTIIESTAEGRTMFTEMWNKAVAATAPYTAKQFKPVFLPWFDDPDCNLELDTPLPISSVLAEYFATLPVKLTDSQHNFWLDQYDELGDRIYQEYPATAEEAFRKINDGSYYGALYNKLVVQRKRLITNLYDANLETHVVLDLGHNDFFVLTYVQIYRKEIRFVDVYYNTGEGLEFYVDKIRETGYNIGDVICPHDITVTELNTNKSRVDRLRELGVTRIIILPRSSIPAGIEQVRARMKYMYFDTSTKYLQDCMVNHAKEWDDRWGVWKDTAAKTDYSHGADTIRYLANYITLNTYEPVEQVYDGMAF